MAEYNLELVIDAKNEASAQLKEVSRDTKKLKETVTDSTKKMSDWVNSFWSALKSIKNTLWWLAIASVFYKWISAVEDARKWLQEYEWQIERLRTLTENSTGATKLMTDELIKQAEAIDKVWVATKDWIVSAQAQFATFDMSTQAIQKLIPAFTDYVIAEKWATASTEDYISMANGLAQALNGNYASLTRTWFILDEETKKIIENWNEMERVQAIVDVLNSTYEWFNERLSTTAEWMEMMRAKERADELEAIAEKTRWLSVTFDEAKTTFVSMLWSLLWVTTKTNDDVSILKDNINKLNDAMAELEANWQSWKISAHDYLEELKKLKEETALNQKELEKEEEWLINVERAEKELEIATISVRQAYEKWQITLEEAEQAFAEIEKQQERLTSAQELWAWATQWQMDMLTKFRDIQKQVEDATKKLADAEKEYASLKADKSATKTELDAMKSKVDSLRIALNQLKDAEKQALNSAPYVSLQNTVSKDLLQQYAEQRTQDHTVYKTNNLWWWGGGWWSWSSKKSNEDTEYKKYLDAREKEYVNYQKAIKKYNQEKEKEEKDSLKKWYEYAVKVLWEQEKKVEDLKKAYEKEFDEITKKIKDSAKEIEKLNKEIDKLNESMSALWKEENKSVAWIVVDSQDALKELEKEFAWITDIAKNTSRDELNDALSWDFIGWYSVENLKKAKWYVDNLASAYDWLSEEQAKELDEAIDYQKWYNWLSDVEKTREDYKIRRDEIQKEIDAKTKALWDEMIKYAELDSDRKKLQDDWLQKIADEETKYNDMYKNIKQYQTDYMKQLADDWITQRTMINDLEAWWKRVADARRDAEAYGSNIEWKASWWDVYGNTPYIVWENWPELFVPKSNWTIVPNNEITNNNGIEINISGVSVRSDADIQSLTDEIIRRIKLEKTFWIA